MGENVIHAMVDDIRANSTVDARCKRHLELGAHTVGAGHEDGIAPAFLVKLKQRPESADGRQNAAPEGLSGHCGDTPLGFISGRNVDAGIGVTHQEARFAGIWPACEF